jgi:hypothetical protein
MRDLAGLKQGIAEVVTIALGSFSIRLIEWNYLNSTDFR